MISLISTVRCVRQQLAVYTCVRKLKTTTLPTKTGKLLNTKKSKVMAIKKLLKSEHTEINPLHKFLVPEEQIWSWASFQETVGLHPANDDVDHACYDDLDEEQIEILRQENEKLKRENAEFAQRYSKQSAENDKLRDNNEILERELESKTHNLREAIVTLKKENEELRREQSQKNLEKEQSIENAKLRKENEILSKRVSALESKSGQLVEEKRNLLSMLLESKDSITERLQLEGRLCARNCVLCCILWVCQHKLGLFLCGPQLALIILRLALERIEEEHLKCEFLMQLLIECKIVDEIDGGEYVYPDDVAAKREMINKVWSKHMATGERVLLLGKRRPNAIGHCEVCDLGRRKGDGKILMCDPQQSEKTKFRSQEEFIEYHVRDTEYEGLKLFSVNLEKLREIIGEHRHVLHLSRIPETIFLL